jgi:hypothetical protein
MMSGVGVLELLDGMVATFASQSQNSLSAP